MLPWPSCGARIIFLGDSHIRYLWDAVQRSAGCNISSSDRDDRWGRTFECRAPCDTRLIYIWSVSPIRISDMSESDNCTYHASLDCRAKVHSLSEYVRRGCNASAPQLLQAELTRLRLSTTVDFIVSDLPQWLLSAEGLHNGMGRPRDYLHRAQHEGCVTQFEDRLLESYRQLDASAVHGLVMCHHLNLSLWGGAHLEDTFFQRLGEGGVPVVRMHDKWTQSLADSHIRSPAINLVLWQRVTTAVGARWSEASERGQAALHKRLGSTALVTDLGRRLSSIDPSDSPTHISTDPTTITTSSSRCAASRNAALETTCAAMQGYRLLNMTAAVCALPMTVLRDETTLARLVRDLGLTNHAGGRIYGSDHTSMLPRSTVQQHLGCARRAANGSPGAVCQHGIGQIPAQIAGALAAMAGMQIRTMLEIGTAAGWTAALLAIVLGRLVSHGDWHSISLDVQDLRTACTAQVQQALGHQFALIPREARQGKAHLDFMHAQADQLLERAGSGGGALVDLCFIDGDHSFQAVQRDYLSIKERCRVLVFHDIVAPEVPGVARLWQMLKLSSEEEGMQWHEFLQQPAGSSLHFDAHGQRHGYLGIGILVRHGKRHSSGPVSQDAGLRAYLSQTYREHTPFDAMGPWQLRQLVGQLAWAYVPAVRNITNLHCRERFEKLWAAGAKGSRQMLADACAADVPLSVALHFKPPTLGDLSFSPYGYFVPRSIPLACSDAPPRFAPDDSWVEVLRLGGDTPSGRPRDGDGCWFVQVASGSGVFAATGRSLHVESRAMLEQHFGLNASISSNVRLARRKYGPYAVEAVVPICTAARAMSYDTVQLWDEHCRTGAAGMPCWVELVSCHDACMHAVPEPLKSKHDSCAPGLPLRTGLNATLPCECHVTEGYRLINCHGTHPDIPAHSRADQGDRELAAVARCVHRGQAGGQSK